MHTNGQMTIPSHLNLGGSLKRDGISTSLVNGRNFAAVKMNSISGYSPAISVKTTNGSWEIGAYDDSNHTDQLIFGYVSDSDYNAGNNRQSKQYRLKATGTPNGYTVLTLDSAFPVGAIYLTWNNTNPGNFLGGTWIRMAEGRSLFGVGNSKDTGGYTRNVSEHEAWGYWKHAISVNELPSHNHNLAHFESYKEARGFGLVTGSVGYVDRVIIQGDYNNSNRYSTTTSTGSGKSFYTTPPYIGIYVWRRTA